ncbi:hypothetical protein NST08_27030 [Paenibacillus sp. FSL K6-1566]|uniref:hypothetical protein n=1 Tax=Paenibacillus TaxID=44249 RepID=UPI00203FC8D9|nr:hypothetical protein [Paenibacillus lactis]MCM3493472.1 hypothetical protein [Paenibacillus lactis]
MSRLEIIGELICLYEECIHSKIPDLFFSKETEIDELYNQLQMLEDQIYSDQERILLGRALELNKILTDAISNKMQIMQQAQQLTQKFSEPIPYNESYFIDKKF